MRQMINSNASNNSNNCRTEGRQRCGRGQVSEVRATINRCLNEIISPHAIESEIELWITRLCKNMFALNWRIFCIPCNINIPRTNHLQGINWAYLNGIAYSWQAKLAELLSGFLWPIHLAIKPHKCLDIDSKTAVSEYPVELVGTVK